MCGWVSKRKRNIVKVRFSDPYQRANERSAEDKQQEVLEWVKTLELEGGIKNPHQLHKRTGLNPRTLTKYKHLWVHSNRHLESTKQKTEQSSPHRSKTQSRCFVSGVSSYLVTV